MKLRKIMAGIVATSVAGTMAVAASAQYDAFVMYASGNWYPALIADASGHLRTLIQAQSQSGHQALQKLLRTVHTQYLSLTSRVPVLMKKQAKKHCFLQRAKALQYSTLISLTSLQL